MTKNTIQHTLDSLTNETFDSKLVPSARKPTIRDAIRIATMAAYEFQRRPNVPTIMISMIAFEVGGLSKTMSTHLKSPGSKVFLDVQRIILKTFNLGVLQDEEALWFVHMGNFNPRANIVSNDSIVSMITIVGNTHVPVWEEDEDELLPSKAEELAKIIKQDAEFSTPSRYASSRERIQKSRSK